MFNNETLKCNHFAGNEIMNITIWIWLLNIERKHLNTEVGAVLRKRADWRDTQETQRRSRNKEQKFVLKGNRWQLKKVVSC